MHGPARVAAVLLAAGCTDTLITVSNRPPEATITAPAEGEVVFEGREIDLQGIASDADGRALDLSYLWTVGGTTVCEGQVESADGRVPCRAIVPVSLEPLAIVLEVRDKRGLPGTASVTVSVVPGEAPAVAILAPNPAGRFYAGLPITFVGGVSDPDDLPTDLTVAWASSVDGPIPALATPDGAGGTTTSAALSQGAHVVTLEAVDRGGRSGRAEIALTVGPPNSAPTCEIELPADGSSAATGLPLTLRAKVADADQPPSELDVVWSSSLAGVLGPSTPASSGEATFTTDALAAGSHDLLVTVTDEAGATCTDTVSIALCDAPKVTVSAPPNNSVWRSTQNVNFAGSATDATAALTSLRFTVTSDLDGQLGTGTLGSQGRYSFQTTPLTRGTHKITTTITNEAGCAGVVVHDILVNAVPTAAQLAISPAAPKRGDPLTATITVPATDADAQPLTMLWLWRRNGGLQADLDTPVVPGDRVVKGDTWVVEGTADDGAHRGPPATASVVIGNTPPTVSAVAISPSTSVMVGDPLTCSATGSDVDLDPLTTTYAWTDGTGAALGAGATINVPAAALTVVCTATVSDGTDSASAQAQVTVSNQAPVITALTITPPKPLGTETLVCDATVTELDGDGFTVTYAWTRGGSSVGTGPTLDLGALGATGGQVYTCTATATDTGSRSSTRTARATIQRPPSTPTVVVSPSDPGPQDTLSCTLSPPSTDPDGDTVVYDVAWTKNGGSTAFGGADVAADAIPSVPGSATKVGETWRCTVTPQDTVQTGTSAFAEVTIGCPVGSGQGSACPATTCADVLAAGRDYGDGRYWIDPDGNGAIEVYCDMTEDDGGWVLLVQGDPISAYTYGHAMWTATSGGQTTAWNPAVDGDRVSAAFYTLPIEETRMCVATYADEDALACITWTHAEDTGRNLANGTPLRSQVDATGKLTPELQSVSAPTWKSVKWQRLGWNHGTARCGGLRVGFTADGDTTDSMDSGIGLGFFLETGAPPCNPADRGTTFGGGYYHFPWIGSAPNPRQFGLATFVYGR